MKESSVTMIGSILWAAAYIASAFVFRHQRRSDAFLFEPTSL